MEKSISFQTETTPLELDEIKTKMYEHPKKVSIDHFKTNKFWNRPSDPYY